MQILPLDLARSASLDALTAFIEGCRQQAEARAHPQLVSIAVEAGFLDPLAVLESIYEPDQLHFYVERRRDGLAIAGAEEAVRFDVAGPGRFEDVKAFVERSLANAIAVGDASLPFFGPHFFGGFSFFDEGRAGAPFPAGLVFVPRWQVCAADGRCVAIANALVRADSDVPAVATRIWNAREKFVSFDYRSVSSISPRPRIEVTHTCEVGGNSFAPTVARALERIRDGAFRKIVLARALDLRANQPFHPLEILNTLRERYADCYAFSLANGKGQSFIGASPERLVRWRASELRVDVLAGTAPRGATASEDARLGSELLRSQKDLREHGLVFESVRRRLADIGMNVDAACQPALRKLENVQHLHVEFAGPAPKGVHLLDAVAALHPTPAVGGTPRESAVSAITEFEAFDRGLYAGPIGWLNAKGEGEFFVAIRSALIDGEEARLFAGVGIVEGSEPEKELAETDLKFRALMENLL